MLSSFGKSTWLQYNLWPWNKKCLGTWVLGRLRHIERSNVVNRPWDSWISIQYQEFNISGGRVLKLGSVGKRRQVWAPGDHWRYWGWGVGGGTTGDIGLNTRSLRTINPVLTCVTLFVFQLHFTQCSNVNILCGIILNMKLRPIRWLYIVRFFCLFWALIFSLLESLWSVGGGICVFDEVDDYVITIESVARAWKYV